MKYLILPILLFSALMCQAQAVVNDRKAISDTCDKVMKYIESGQEYESIRIMKNNTVISTKVMDDLGLKMKEQMDVAVTNYGRVLSWQFVKEKTIGDYLVRRLYILRFERYYLKYAFTLYKGARGWMITGFVYNEEIDELY